MRISNKAYISPRAIVVAIIPEQLLVDSVNLSAGANETPDTEGLNKGTGAFAKNTDYTLWDDEPVEEDYE